MLIQITLKYNDKVHKKKFQANTTKILIFASFPLRHSEKNVKSTNKGNCSMIIMRCNMRRISLNKKHIISNANTSSTRVSQTLYIFLNISKQRGIPFNKLSFNVNSFQRPKTPLNRCDFIYCFFSLSRGVIL